MFLLNQAKLILNLKRKLKKVKTKDIIRIRDAINCIIKERRELDHE